MPIAIAGSRLCAEAVLADLGIPLPDCYTTQASFPIRKPTNDIDLPQPKFLRHHLESLLSNTWNHLSLLVVISLVGVLVTYLSSNGRSPVDFRAAQREPDTKGAGRGSEGGLADNWPAMIVLVGVLGMRLFRAQQPRGQAA